MALALRSLTRSSRLLKQASGQVLNQCKNPNLVSVHSQKPPLLFSQRFGLVRSISHLAIRDETVEEMICRYECIFSREDADGWDVRQAMNDLAGYDSVPEPRIIIAGLHACRRLNDYAMAVRFLELVKDKCGNNVAQIYPYIVQEVGPTVAELGCDFPETLGYDKPELWLVSPYDL